MKLATYRRGDAAIPVVIVEDVVHALADLDPSLPACLEDLLERGAPAMAALKRALDRVDRDLGVSSPHRVVRVDC